MTDTTTPAAASRDRRISKREANRVAAAKVYVAASKKAGRKVPQSVAKLARQPR